MKAIIGLGNPGADYSKTRHNAGFWVLDLLMRELAPAPTNWQRKGSCEYLKGKLAGEDVILAKPLTFINLSGDAVVPLLQFFQIPVEDLVVVHDELDLSPGAMVLKQGGGSGGHNGVEDIILKLGSKEFTRIRVGIGHPKSLVPEGSKWSGDVSSWVLGRPGPEDIKMLIDATALAADAVKILLRDGLDAAMRQCNRR